MSQQSPSSPEEVAAQQSAAPIRITDPANPHIVVWLAMSPNVMYLVDDNDGWRKEFTGARIDTLFGTWKLKNGECVFERLGFERAGSANMTNGGS